jgi:Zn-dependent peptidase ImmA (M78 family)
MTNYAEDVITFYDPVRHNIVKKTVGGNTVIIDSRMAESVNKGRYTYTAGHECGHIVLDNPDIRQRKEESRVLMMECAEDFCGAAAYHTGETLTAGKPHDNRLWTEHYCDQFASCFLMPASMVKAAAIDVFRKHGIKSDCFYPHSEAEKRLCIEIAKAIAVIFETSKEAAFYKLCDLKLIRDGRKIFEQMTSYRN